MKASLSASGAKRSKITMVAFSAWLMLGAGCFGAQASPPSGVSAVCADDVRVAAGYKDLVEFQPGKAIAALCAPYIEAVNSGNRKKAARYILLIAHAFRQDDNDAGAAYCSQLAVKLDPDNILAVVMAAEHLYRAGRPDEAEKMWRRLDKEPAGDRLVLRARGIERAAKGNFDDAERYWRKAAETDETELPSRAKLATIYWYRHDLENASKLYAECEASVPGSYQKAIFAGMLAEGKKDLKKAEEHYKAAGAIAPDDPLWHDRLGLLYIEMKQKALAGTQFQQAVRCPRLSFLAAVHYAAFLTYCGQPFKSTQVIKQLVPIKPYSADVHHALASSYRVTGRLHEAELELRKALALNPRRNQSYQLLASLDTIKKDDAKLREILNQWKLNCPDNWECLSNCAGILVSDRKWDEAKELLIKANSVRPQKSRDAGFSLKLCRLYSGLSTCYYQEKDMTAALEFAKLFNAIKPPPEERAGVPLRPPAFDFAAHKPDSSEYKAAEHGALGDVLFECKELDSAAKEYNEAISFDPKNIVWHAALLKVCIDKRDVAGAAKEDAIVSQHIINQVCQSLNFGKKKEGP